MVGQLQVHLLHFIHYLFRCPIQKCDTRTTDIAAFHAVLSLVTCIVCDLSAVCVCVDTVYTDTSERENYIHKFRTVVVIEVHITIYYYYYCPLFVFVRVYYCAVYTFVCLLFIHPSIHLFIYLCYHVGRQRSGH